ncbi:MAG: cell surface protein [Halobacteriales archaeon]|nr:cell surface protein [Halobacteriales archaeon]
MVTVEVNVPEHLDMQIAQLVDQGDFVNREEAVEQLLSTGIKAYKTSGPIDDDDGAGFDTDLMGHEDEYVF